MPTNFESKQNTWKLDEMLFLHSIYCVEGIFFFLLFLCLSFPSSSIQLKWFNIFACPLDLYESIVNINNENEREKDKEQQENKRHSIDDVSNKSLCHVERRTCWFFQKKINFHWIKYQKLSTKITRTISMLCFAVLVPTELTKNHIEQKINLMK